VDYKAVRDALANLRRTNAIRLQAYHIAKH